MRNGSRLGTGTMVVETGKCGCVLNILEEKNNYITSKTQKLKCVSVNSLCQGALQYVGCVWIRQTSCFIQWIELNEMVPQHTNQLLGFGVQTYPEKQRHFTTYYKINFIISQNFFPQVSGSQWWCHRSLYWIS